MKRIISISILCMFAAFAFAQKGRVGIRPSGLIGGVVRYSNDNMVSNFQRPSLTEVPLRLYDKCFDGRRGNLYVYLGSGFGWASIGMNNGMNADVTWTINNQDTLDGWDATLYNRALINKTTASSDTIFIAEPSNFLSQTPSETFCIDINNNRLSDADTLIITFDSLFRTYDGNLFTWRVPPRARQVMTFRVTTSVEGIYWLNTDDILGSYGHTPGGGGGGTELYYSSNPGGGEQVYSQVGTPTGNIYEDMADSLIIPIAENWKYSDTFNLPTAFRFDPGFDIWRNGDGTYETAISDKTIFHNTYFPGGKAYYVDPIGGNNANTGLTKAQALQTVAAAVAKGDMEVCMLKGAIYPNVSTFGPASTKFSVIGYDGTPIIGKIAANPTWSSTTRTGVFKCTVSDTIPWVLDLYRRGSMGEYARMSAAADTNSLQPGEYIYTSATTLYVYPTDGVSPSPTSNVILVDYASTGFTGSDTIYLENLIVLGRTSFGTGSQKVRINNCDFFYSPNNDLISFADTCNVILNNVTFGHCKNDCIDYDQLTEAVEINCYGRFAGYDYSGADNQLSTAHDSSMVISINCDYGMASNESILDVNSGTQRIILGGRMGGTWNREPSFGTYAVGVGNNTADFATMWIFDTKLGGNVVYDLYANFGTIYLSNVKINSTTRLSLLNGGQILKY